MRLKPLFLLKIVLDIIAMRGCGPVGLQTSNSQTAVKETGFGQGGV